MVFGGGRRFRNDIFGRPSDGEKDDGLGEQGCSILEDLIIGFDNRICNILYNI